MIRTLGSESVKCFANPGACFYNALVKNNPNTMIICYCSLSRGGSSIVLGLNESGEYLKEDNRQGMNNNFKMLNLSN